jgi:hypothetical protein
MYNFRTCCIGKRQREERFRENQLKTSTVNQNHFSDRLANNFFFFEQPKNRVSLLCCVRSYKMSKKYIWPRRNFLFIEMPIFYIYKYRYHLSIYGETVVRPDYVIMFSDPGTSTSSLLLMFLPITESKKLPPR